jgi:uncharacterized membrane protein YdjX (TVP38/TMEM64 family)
MPVPVGRRFRLLLALVLAVGLVLLIRSSPDATAVWTDVRSRLVEWQTFAQESPFLSVAIFFVAYVAVAGLSLPFATVMSLLAGALFGRWLGTLVAISAATGGATLAFLSSRYLLRDWVQERFGPRLKFIEEGMTRDGASFLLTIRLIPLFPFFVINLLMGLTPIRTSTYVWASWLGMIPGAFAIVNVGTAAAKVESPRGVLSLELILAISLLGVLPFLLKWILRVIRRQPQASS